jgi:large subunit ribosomal protein L13
MPTYFPSTTIGDKKWILLDAEGQVLGRLAVRAARILMGKNKPTYTTFMDTGDHVIVINASKIQLTGQKINQKVYRYHTGFPGGVTEHKAAQMKEKRPDRMIREAVEGMLPKTKLGKAMNRKLRVYVADKHPHASQKPETEANPVRTH